MFSGVKRGRVKMRERREEAKRMLRARRTGRGVGIMGSGDVFEAVR